MTCDGQKAERKQKNDYATVEDFRAVFAKGTDELSWPPITRRGSDAW